MPAVVDTQASNLDQGLTVISLQGQNQRDDVADDHYVQVGKDLGIEHAMGDTAYFGEYSPYFNLNKNSSTTYGFIIGRNGVVRWRGDLGNKLDEYFEALSLALAAPSLAPLKGSMAPELEKAMAFWVVDDLGRARKEAIKVRAKSARGSKPEAQAANVQASKIVDAISTYEAGLIASARAAVDGADAEGFARAVRSLRAFFPKSEHHNELKALSKGLKQAPELAEKIEAWETWLELAATRPVTFPARHDKPNGRFARTLAKYAGKYPGAPGAGMAQAWLATWEAGAE